MMLRNVLIGATLAAGALFAAIPAGASTPHPKYVNAVKDIAPGLDHFKAKTLVADGEEFCSSLEQYGVGEGVFSAFAWIHSSDSPHPLSEQDADTIEAGAAKYLCPAFNAQVARYQLEDEPDGYS